MQREIAHNLATGERRTTDVAPGKVKSFTELNLRREIVVGLQRSNFLTPTQIQAAAIPMALSKNDLLIQSKSGTGKTLIYAIAALQGFDPSIKTPQVLVVVPTRELAIQVHDTISILAEYLPKLRTTHVIGGTVLGNDRKRLYNSSVVIGTPGRLMHLCQNSALCVSNLSLLVLDEADQLYLSDGMQKHIKELIRALPAKIQKIACSATYERNLDEQLAKTMCRPVLISNSERATVLLGIRQFVYELPKQLNNMAEMNCKLDAVIKIFNLVPYEQVVLFASSKMRADSFRNYLASRGVECHLISGAMSQEERLKVFDCYRFFSMRTLVATDVFARGVDSPHTNLIVNLDPPKYHVDYLHRIGRAGRFGSKGIAITLVFEGTESDRFKSILSKAPTGKSVLEFPKEPKEGLDFWNFQNYDFPYYITDEEKHPLAEDAPKEKEASSDGVASLKKDAAREEEAVAHGESSMNRDVLKEENVVTDGDASETNSAPIEKEDAEVDISLKKDAPVKEKALTDVDNPKVNSAPQKKDATMKEDTPQVVEECQEANYESASCDSSIEVLESLPDDQKPKISVIACQQLVETIHDALIEDNPETSGEEPPEISPKQDQTDCPALNQIVVENASISNNYKPSVVPLPEETISPGQDLNKEQPPPMIMVNELELPGDMEADKEKQPKDNKNNLEEFISPELTPSSLTPLELTQEPPSPTTLTPPAPPANSINNKTYCVAAPTATSSMTLQAMVMSNTVDDASSISSDGSMGSRSESYSSFYSETDEKQIWKKFVINQGRLKRAKSTKRRHLMFPWLSSLVVSYVKRKRKHKPRKIAKGGANRCSLQIPNYFRPIEKMERVEEIVKRLQDYVDGRKLNCLEINLLFKHLHDVYVDIYGGKSIADRQQSSKSKDNDGPQNKLSVHVTHHMNIPPLPAAAAAAADEDPDGHPDSDSEVSQHSEEFGDGEEDYDDHDDEEEEEEESDSSSGFVESNESVSSGIDTSEYGTQTSSEEDQYQESDGDTYDSNDSYDPMYDFELTAEEIECEEEEEDEQQEEDDEVTGSNVSLAGTDYQGSVSSSEEHDPDNFNAELDAEESQPEEVDGEESQSYAQDEVKAIYQQMFQTQYQFIVSHVASHMARP